ncbi:MAG: tRNA lysidine(34) synthetase TilS [Anaerolineae bacterium]
MTLYRRFLNTLEQDEIIPHLAGQTVVVAVSGGPDSVCLLHLLNRAATPLNSRLVAATFDHGIRGAAAEEDVRFVETLARAWQIPVESGFANTPALAQQHAMGLEEAARRARYSFLAHVANKHRASTIAVGHHADDQAETVLMHLIRGAGLAGLGGMRPVTHLTVRHLLPVESRSGPLAVVRPLLRFTRAEIEAYCVEHRLNTRKDATNTDLVYQRNRIRHELLPLLAALNPNIRQILARTADLLYDDYAKLHALANETLGRLTITDGDGWCALNRDLFRREHIAIQRLVLRLAVAQLTSYQPDLSFSALESARLLAVSQQASGTHALPGKTVLQLDYGRLIIHLADTAPPAPDLPLLPSGTRLPVPLPGEVRLPDSPWTLSARWLAPGEDPAQFHGNPLSATLCIPEDARLELRTRQPGDRFMPFGLRGQTQKLKTYLINARVPAAIRDALPLLTIDGTLAWVCAGPQSRIAEPFAVTPESTRVALFEWHHA